MKIASLIKHSFLESVKGKENIATVFFGWGFGLYILTSIIMFFSIFPIGAFFSIQYLSLVIMTFEFFIKFFIGIYGFIFCFLYPIFISWALIRCSVGKVNFFVVFLLFIFISMFLIIHYGIFIKFFFTASRLIVISFPILINTIFNL